MRVALHDAGGAGPGVHQQQTLQDRRQHLAGRPGEAAVPLCHGSLSFGGRDALRLDWDGVQLSSGLCCFEVAAVL